MRTFAFVGVVLISAVLTASGAEPPTTAPADSATGTWTYTLRIEDLTIDAVAELKQVGGTITGTAIVGAAKEPSPITNGKISGHEIEFTVDRVAGDQRIFEMKYSGRLEGDQIRGRVISGWLSDDQPPKVTLEWVARRVKGGNKPKPDVR